MASASLTISDTPSGLCVEADFGEQFDEGSQSHQVIDLLLRKVLETAQDTGRNVSLDDDTVTPSSQPKEQGNGI